jgi:hypothetical protein
MLACVQAGRFLARVRGVVALLLVLTGACSAKPSGPAYSAPPAPRPATGAEPWPAPADALAFVRKAGLQPQLKESFTFHIHAHLDIYVNGRPVTVPAGMGINIHDPGVRHSTLPSGGDAYGGIQICSKPCISPLHTHQPDGIVHIEDDRRRDYRLGQFFAEWGVNLDPSCVGGYCEPGAKVAVFVDGKRHQGDPAGIVFENHEEIAVVIGSPPDEIPSTYTTPEA